MYYRLRLNGNMLHGEKCSQRVILYGEKQGELDSVENKNVKIMKAKGLILCLGMALLSIHNSGYCQFRLQPKKTVAILNTLDKENNLEYAAKVMIRTYLSDAVGYYGKENFEVYERTDIGAIVDEWGFQQSGYVQESQIKEIGHMTGVDYILVSEVVGLGNKQILLTAKLINVETGRIEGGTPNRRCDVDYDDYDVACMQLAKKLLYRLVE